MNLLATALLALLPLSTLTTPSTPGTLDKTRIPSDARWLVHTDIDALRGSALFAAFSKEDSRCDLGTDLEEIRTELGLDPIADLHSVTLWCSTTSPDATVVMLRGDAKLDSALAKLREQADWRSETAGARSLDAWGSEDEVWYAWTRGGSEGAERLALASRSRDQLLRGVAVVEGAAESLAAAQRPAITASPVAGSILFAATGPLAEEFAGVEDPSAVARLARGLVLDVGEERGDLFASLLIDTASPEDALRVQQVIQGAVALAGLMSEDPEVGAGLARLAAGLRVSTEGPRAAVAFRCEIQRLVRDLEALEDR